MSKRSVLDLSVDKPTSFKSALAGFADEDELAQDESPERYKFWFHDPQKLLASVVRHARESPEFAREFVTAAGTLAAQSEEKALRTALDKALISDASRSPGRSRKQRWFCSLLAGDYYELHHFQKMKSGEAYEFLGKRYNLSASRVRQLVTRDRKYWEAVSKSTISSQDGADKE